MVHVHAHGHSMSCLPAGSANYNEVVLLRQMQQLYAETKKVRAELKEAWAALLKDPDNKLLRKRVDDLKEVKAGLDERSEAMDAKLLGATHEDTWEFLPACVCTAGTCTCITLHVHALHMCTRTSKARQRQQLWAGREGALHGGAITRSLRSPGLVLVSKWGTWSRAHEVVTCLTDVRICNFCRAGDDAATGGGLGAAGEVRRGDVGWQRRTRGACRERVGYSGEGILGGSRDCGNCSCRVKAGK